MSAARASGLLCAALVAAASAARADEPGQRAAQIWRAIASGKGDARAQVEELQAALAEAKLPLLSTAALARLAGEGSPSKAAQAAARDALTKRADSGDAASAEALLAIDLDGRSLADKPALALRLARAHLDRALLTEPLQEGGSFEAEDAEPTPAAPAALQKDAPAEEARKKAVAHELAEAVQLAQSAGGAEGHEVAGLAALAMGDELTAEREFSSLSIATAPADKADPQQHALLQLARLAYARGDDARAQRLYSRVARSSSEWLDALFEASWAHYRRGEDEQVLGNLLTLQAPFFQGRDYPEAYVLQALVLYQNCRYADARRSLARLDQVFRPRHDALAAALLAVDSLGQPFEALTPARASLEARLSPLAKAELERAATAPDLAGEAAAVQAMSAELDSFDARPALAQTRLAQEVLPPLRAWRLQLLDGAGKRLKARLAGERGELRELLGQALRLSYEISGREREAATDPAARAQPRKSTGASEIDDDEVEWPFQGEYWRDELGSYRFQLGMRCVPAPRFQQRATRADLTK